MDKQQTHEKNELANPLQTTTTPVGAIATRRKQLEQMRPTLIVGAGGTGQYILTYLKALLTAGFADLWPRRIRLLAFDTAEETFQAQAPNGLVSLESGDEFFHIGNVPVGSIMRHIDSQEAIQERLGAVLAKLPAGVLRSGAKQLRPFGLMSLLWNHSTVSQQLRQALWELAGRNQVDAALSQQQGINVFLCGSLVGGTGSGAMLDLAYLIRQYFTELGVQAEFCHITGVGVLPQAFHGIKGPNLLPNTGAFLQELNHLMVKGNFHARYPDGRKVQSREAPFDIFYAVDGVDQGGRTWADIYAVTTMTAYCIYLQMGTQLGRKGENAFDNLDEVLSGVTANGQGTFLGSFGKGELLFDAPAVAAICARWFLLELLQQVWLQPVVEGDAARHADFLLAGVKPDQVQSSLRRDPETGGEIRNDLSLPGWLARKAAGEVAAEATRYVQAYGQARVAEKMLAQISQNGAALAADYSRQWADWLQARLFVPETSLDTVLALLRRIQDRLAQQMKAAQQTTAELKQQETRLEQSVAQRETAVAKAAASFPIGRNGRIRAALSHYFRAAQEWYDVQLQTHLAHTQLQLWHELRRQVETHSQAITTLRHRLAGVTAKIESEAGRMVQQVSKGGVAAISLAGVAYMQALYARHKPARTGVKEQINDPLSLCHLNAEALSRLLLAALRPNFAQVEAMTIEQVLQEQADGMSPRARRQQLFRLATPSWNVDRARLPEGGANLVRLEVLGVPDAADTLFEGEPMLVSTHDPHRLTALVVAAGAPPSALQQYDLYMQAMEQVKGKRPLHILPDFLASADQGPLYFALGSIFGLIYSQGTFFYYQPADPLATPVKLANGLSNAIHIFSEQEELVNEVNERVERQNARLGLREAIRILTEYYTSTPNGATALDDQLRQLKRLVRDYADGLRRIDAFSTGIHEDAVRSS